MKELFPRTLLAAALMFNALIPWHAGAAAFINTGSLNTARDAHSATLLGNGKVLVAGGGGPAFLSSAELYEPGTGTWTITGALNTARNDHTATLLPNGKVLIAGGFSGGGAGSPLLLPPPATSTLPPGSSVAV